MQWRGWCNSNNYSKLKQLNITKENSNLIGKLFKHAEIIKEGKHIEIIGLDIFKIFPRIRI